MFNWIRSLSDGQMLSFILIAGMLGWVVFVGGFIVLSKLWDKVTASTVYRCEMLRRENAHLRKKLREAALQNARH